MKLVSVQPSTKADKKYMAIFENAGLLKNQDFMQDIPFYDIDYCMYSDFGYRKRTRIWTCVNNFKPLLCNKECGNMDGKKHKNSCGNGNYGSVNQQQKYRIPEKLIQKLFILNNQGRLN